MGKGYFHVSSHGLERNDIFKNREDFVQGMNDIAIIVLGFDVVILAFCLMSNHFHFVLYGTRSECVRFAEEYKRRCSIRMRYSAGDVHAMKDVEVQLFHVGSAEYLENVIAYVLRNPIAAGICMMPYHYMWSSMSLYFTGGKQYQGKSLNEMSERKRFRTIKSRACLPDHYVVDELGMILPSCYVDVGSVEKIFRHPARLMAAVSRKIEADVEVTLGISDSVTMSYDEIKTQLPDLIRKEFGKDSLNQLSMDQRIRLCLLIKRNFRAGVKQIARLTHLDPNVVSKVI
jgi:REP element-mobilizing transposase RayT